MMPLKLTMGMVVLALTLASCDDAQRRTGAGKAKPSQPASRTTMKQEIQTDREAEDLMRTVADDASDVETRCQAARRLGKLRSRAMVPRLLEMLPGEGNVMTREIIVALGEIGDWRALPVLEDLYKEDKHEFHGKIRVSLRYAIEQCRKDGR